MRILVSGATGFIGAELCRRLRRRGDDVVELTHSDGASANQVYWQPHLDELDPAPLEGFDAAVHLAGEPIDGRWTPDKKKRIHDSRVQGTSLLARTLAGLKDPPRTLISASATGYYGDRGDETLDEASPAGETFLAGLCRDWEAAADPAREAGLRVVHPRFGMVLGPEGGALRRIAKIFRAGVGGRIGSGRQFWAWITREDTARAVEFLLAPDGPDGPVNIIAPEPVRNERFTEAMAKATDRWTLLPAPGFMLRLVYGEMADDVLLASTRAVPAKLGEAGFEWRDGQIEPALWKLLRDWR